MDITRQSNQSRIIGEIDLVCLALHIAFIAMPDPLETAVRPSGVLHITLKIRYYFASSPYNHNKK